MPRNNTSRSIVARSTINRSSLANSRLNSDYGCIIRDGLVSVWDFTDDDNSNRLLKDRYGGYDLSMDSGWYQDSWGYDPGGGGYFDMDGTDDLFHAGTASATPNLQPGTGDYSGSIFFNIDDDNTSYSISAFGKPSNNGKSGIRVAYIGITANDPIRIWVRDTSNNTIQASFDTGGIAGNWKFITYQINRTTNRIRLFMNGSKLTGSNTDISSVTGSLNTNDDSFPFMIGGGGGTPSAPVFKFNGKMGLNIIHRKAITLREHNFMFNGLKSLYSL